MQFLIYIYQCVSYNMSNSVFYLMKTICFSFKCQIYNQNFYDEELLLTYNYLHVDYWHHFCCFYHIFAAIIATTMMGMIIRA